MKKYILAFIFSVGLVQAHALELRSEEQFEDIIEIIITLLEEIISEEGSSSKFVFSGSNQKEKLQKIEQTLHKLQGEYSQLAAQTKILESEKQRLEERNQKQIATFNALQQEHTNLQAQAQEIGAFSKKLQETYKGDLESLQKIYEDYRTKLLAIDKELCQKKDGLQETFSKHQQEIDENSQKFLR
jgi:chromosome segregation ATPase